jgi:hypothetical protein
MTWSNFPQPGSGRGYDAWAFLFPLLLMLHAGGRSLEDLRKITDDEGLLRLLEIQDTPSTDTLGDWLRRLGWRGVRALRSINRKLRKKALKGGGRTGYTLDIDATVIEAWKEQALFTYKHHKGYVPILGHLAESGLVVAWEFREGNVPPAKENVEFYRQCKASMPAGKRITAFRADAASYQGDLFDELAEDKVAYAVGGRLDKATLEGINAIRPEQWRPYQDGWIAETVHTMNEMKTAFRLVVIKRPAQPGLFGDESPSDRYHVIASNRGETAEEMAQGEFGPFRFLQPGTPIDFSISKWVVMGGGKPVGFQQCSSNVGGAPSNRPQAAGRTSIDSPSGGSRMGP